MNYGEIKKVDIANGPGVRVSLFVSGCTHHCPGCFNADTWDFGFGKEYTAGTQEEILEALSPPHIAGLTVLGGEPFEPDNQRELLPLIREVRSRFPEKSVWMYSGYLFDREILSTLPAGEVLPEPPVWVPYRSAHCEVTDELLSLIDVLVDGKFIAAEKDLSLRFRGSRNQRLIDVQASLSAGTVTLWQG
ncbi:MAG: anaerobic ribonucleoside-triphosphate reductase activating protein [Lachnospiraceae bacterium]|nr:anaerobic ribonucleoside-triphosphate reductase activating protein [Lachnospiraceae bacterium]